MKLIVFVGQDISRIAVAMSRTQAQLYGLNGYALQLEAAVVEALTARQQQTENGQVLTLQSPVQIIKNVYRNGDTPPPTNGKESSSFEQMFRAVAAAPEAVPVQSCCGPE